MSIVSDKMKEEKKEKETAKVVSVGKNKYDWKNAMIHASIFSILTFLGTVLENWDVITQFINFHATTAETMFVAGLLSPFVKKLIEHAVNSLTSKFNIQWQ